MLDLVHRGLTWELWSTSAPSSVEVAGFFNDQRRDKILGGPVVPSRGTQT